MSESIQTGLSKWVGTYYPRAEFWGGYFYPLLIEPNGDLYLRKTKLSYSFDANTETLAFSGQVVGDATPVVRITFSKQEDGRNQFRGVMYPKPGDGPGGFSGQQMLRTQVWAAPTGPMDLPLIGRVYIGDHTWISMEGRNCWRVVGGGEGHYCGTDKWQRLGSTDVYFPPEGRLLGSTADGNAAMMSCMGGEEHWQWGIPAYAGIVYGFHGVCHQMTNRLLLGAGKFTVFGAEGYALSAVTYGLYGTTFPRQLYFLFAIPLIGPAILGYALGINIAFGIQCGNCGAPYPGPILAEGAETRDAGQERRLVERVLALHAHRHAAKGLDAVLAAPTEDKLMHLEDANGAHREELRLLLEYKSGAALSERKLQQVVDCFCPRTGAFEDALRQAASNLPATAVALQDFEAPAAFNPMAVAEDINMAVIRTQQEAANILTRDEFAMLFDRGPDQLIGLVDPRIMARRPRLA